MATKLLKRMGVADDPTALQPSLNDCIEAMLQHADTLMTEVLVGLQQAASPNHPRRVQAFQQGGIKMAIESLNAHAKSVCEAFKSELTRLVYEGGGKEQVATELLRFEDLKLFEDEQLDASIEVARAQQEVSTAVDDVLPALDSLVSTLLGWRTIQPGLNPLRPDVFVRALQHTLSQHLPEITVREALIAPAGGLLGVQLRKLYRELSEWLMSTGVEAAVPIGGRLQQGVGGHGKPVADSVAKTLLTLDKLRKLLAGDFDAPKPKQDFLHTVPASMALLQDLKGGADALLKRLQERNKPAAAPQQPVDMLAEPPPPAPSPAAQKIGQQLGDEVVRLMFDNLSQDARLLPAFKAQLKVLGPAIHRLAEQDSRFFSDRNHPARQLLDRLTQRSLAFSSEKDEGWARFMVTVESAAQWATQSKVVDADTFGELLDSLQAQWTQHDQTLKHRREEAARALLHAEQRNLLAQKLAAEFVQMLEGLDVADFIADFLRNAWAQVVAEDQLSCADGESDPHGYRALVEDLVWSVQKSTAQRGRAKRLVQMIPGLLTKLREGLDRIGYPPELTQRFFDNLITIHRDAVQDGRDPQVQAAAESAWSEPSQFPADAEHDSQMWLDDGEVQESGFVDEDAAYAPEHVASPEAVQQEQQTPGAAPLRSDELRAGSWVEIHIKGQWLRAQLTWASPHGTLFMFTSIAGTAHSMSRRTLDKLRAHGMIRVVAERNVVDEALDQVAQQALKNSLKPSP
jgi:hypothetical protein